MARHPSLNRRTFLALLGTTGASAALAPRALDLSSAAATEVEAAAGAPPVVDPAFPFGVAAGDPLPDGAVTWTRIDPAADGGGGGGVRWGVAADPGFATLLAAGSATASATADHTVHARVQGLAADGWYHYRFAYSPQTLPGELTEVVSRSGRLRTAPASGAGVARLRFAFSSCQQTSSPYVAHREMATEDLDFVVHYGDYVYVSDHGTLTVDDYRSVYRRFKADPWLQELHATFPMVSIWDDGEFANGVDRHFPPARFDAARQAWFEYQPVLRPGDDPNRAYRRLQWGGLADFLLLDVRQYRDQLIDANDHTTLLATTDTALPSGAAIFDPDRTCLGATQKAWLFDNLRSSTATWRHLGTPYPFVALRLDDYDTPEIRANPPEDFHPNGGKYISTEQWDGYWAERREIMDLLHRECIQNVVITSGHTHVYFAAGLRPDFDDLPVPPDPDDPDSTGSPGSPVVAWEFTTGSLTADPDPRQQYFPDMSVPDAEAAIHQLEGAFLALNPHVDHIDLLHQGYGIATFEPGAATVEFRVVDTFDPGAVAATSARWTVPAGSLPSDRAGCVVDPPPATTTPGSTITPDPPSTSTTSTTSATTTSTTTTPATTATTSPGSSSSTTVTSTSSPATPSTSRPGTVTPPGGVGPATGASPISRRPRYTG